MPPTGGGTRTFHLLSALAGVSDCRLFVLFPVKKTELPASVIENCSSVHCSATPFATAKKSSAGELLKNLRLLFAPWSFPKNVLVLNAGYLASNPYPGKNILKKAFFLFQRHIVVGYARLLYRLGYSIPARSLERYEQYYEMKEQISSAIERSQILWIDFSTLFPFFKNLRKDGLSAKIICNAHNIEYRLLETIEKFAKDRLELNWCRCQSAIMKKAELKGFSECDLVMVCSERDREEILSNLPCANVEVVPNGVDLEYFIPDNKPTPYPSVLFTGTMGYEPNRDAVVYFIENIFPRVLRSNPSCRFIIAGANAGSVFKKFGNNEHIEIISSPADMRPVYNKAWIVVVPLRSGSGTRLKILEAMAMEKPVVTTSIGAEGIMVNDKNELFIADDEKEFAEKIELLISDKRLADRMVAAAKETVTNLYSWQKIRENAAGSILQLTHK